MMLTLSQRSIFLKHKCVSKSLSSSVLGTQQLPASSAGAVGVAALFSSTDQSGGTTKRYGGTKMNLYERKGADYYYFLPKPYSASVTPPAPTKKFKGKKVSVIGVGQVGLAISYALANSQIASTISLVDMNQSKIEGEADDMIHGSAFHARTTIEASTDYDIVDDSDLVIITAGAAQKPGESRLSLVGRNVAIMKNIIPSVLHYAPDAAICVVSNPCDIMTAVASKIAGPSVPPGQIFGSGTNLDSSRLRSIIANSVNVDARDVSGFVIGEHGDSSVAAWGTFNVAGVPVLEPGEEPNDTHIRMHRAVVESAGDVILKKGYTNWAVGMATVDIAKAVLGDHMGILPVSTCVRGDRKSVV